MVMELKFKDIKPIGHLEAIFEVVGKKVHDYIEEIHQNPKLSVKYLKIYSELITEFGMMDVLESDILNKVNTKEARICLLYLHLLMIELNDVAQFYMNNITIPSKIQQIQEYIDGEGKQYFDNLTIIE